MERRDTGDNVPGALEYLSSLTAYMPIQGIPFTAKAVL